MTPKLTPEQKKLLQQAQIVLPTPIMQILKRVFTLRGAQFFQFYVDLKDYELGALPVPPDLRSIFLRSVNFLSQVTSPVDQQPLSPIIVNHLAEARPDMSMLLGRLVAGKIHDTPTWGKINDRMVPLILEA
ncbi:MAG: hypothetical protein WC824_08925, partial [Bacteroidota bacterium]